MAQKEITNEWDLDLLNNRPDGGDKGIRIVNGSNVGEENKRRGETVKVSTGSKRVNDLDSL
jgi:hypothetical protein